MLSNFKLLYALCAFFTSSLRTCARVKAVVALTPVTDSSTQYSHTYSTCHRSPVSSTFTFTSPPSHNRSTMARGDECKAAFKANHAYNQFDVSAPIKKPVANQPTVKDTKKPEQKNYGAWGPTFKDKKTFMDMHLC